MAGWENEMIGLLLANWKYVAIAALSAALAVTWSLYRGKAAELTDYRSTVAAEGRIAAEEKKRIEAHQQQVLEDVSNAWNAQIKPTREAAVAAYLARHRPTDVRHSDGVLYRPGSGSLPEFADRPKRIDGASEEFRPDEALIKDCADDAMKVEAFQTFVIMNGLPVK